MRKQVHTQIDLKCEPPSLHSDLMNPTPAFEMPRIHATCRLFANHLIGSQLTVEEAPLPASADGSDQAIPSLALPASDADRSVYAVSRWPHKIDAKRTVLGGRFSVKAGVSPSKLITQKKQCI